MQHTGGLWTGANTREFRRCGAAGSMPERRKLPHKILGRFASLKAQLRFQLAQMRCFRLSTLLKDLSPKPMEFPWRHSKSVQPGEHRVDEPVHRSLKARGVDRHQEIGQVVNGFRR